MNKCYFVHQQNVERSPPWNNTVRSETKKTRFDVTDRLKNMNTVTSIQGLYANNNPALKMRFHTWFEENYRLETRVFCRIDL